MLTIPGSSITIPADAIESRPTAYPDAWWGHPLTIRLHHAYLVVRLARSHGGILGDWFALNADFSSPSQFAALHSIPPRGNEADVSLKHAASWELQRGTILNVGRCAPLFGHPGGGYQAEFLDGSLPAIRSHAEL